MAGIGYQSKTRISRVLIANRGEIVSRILRTLKSMRIEGVVIYTDEDADKPYVRQADFSFRLSGHHLEETHLNQDKIIRLATLSGADAIHPGYGFLSENADFAEKCQANGFIWIGPNPKVMQKMADKVVARNIAQEIGIPILGASQIEGDLLKADLDQFTFPILLKAAAGGGGRGMRVVRNQEEWPNQLATATKEAHLAFGDGRLFAEDFIDEARHVEVQVLGDQHGSLIHLFERECSIQRRYQKIIEESPSPSISAETREALTQAAVKLARHVGYDNAGTIEFLVDPMGQFYYIETNARLQVEHPVTESITGIDLVEQQIKIAAGEPLNLTQKDIHLSGHAIECRICAEDPKHDFSPSPGKLSYYSRAGGRNIRVDDAVTSGSSISSQFDSLIAKVIAHGPTRSDALSKTRQALTETVVHGIPNNIAYLNEVIAHQAVHKGYYPTNFIQFHHKELIQNIENKAGNGLAPVLLGAYAFIVTAIHDQTKPSKRSNPWTRLGPWRHFHYKAVAYNGDPIFLEIQKVSDTQVRYRSNGTTTQASLQELKDHYLRIDIDRQDYTIEWSENDSKYFMSCNGLTAQIDKVQLRQNGNLHHNHHSGEDENGKVIQAPLPGKVSRIFVRKGEKVSKGQALAIIESMKTENQVISPCDCIVEETPIILGHQVKMKEVLFTLKPVIKP